MRDDVLLEQYTFVPWVRTGLAAAIHSGPGESPRATIEAAIEVTDTNDDVRPVSRPLVLRGPGDVVGIDPAQIVRRVPPPDSRDVEANYLVHIEFDRPDLPWLFTPFAPDGDRLTPWISLVVCDAAHSELLSAGSSGTQQLSTWTSELQGLADAWMFAHAQTAGVADNKGSVAERLSDGYREVNLSRILCPRKLAPGKSYIAALVPTFSCSSGTLKPAWIHDGTDRQILLPVYDAWRFSTQKEAIDFEALVRRLKGIAAPRGIGRRIVDMSHPGGAVGALDEHEVGRTQVLRCALVSPATHPDEAPGVQQQWTPERRAKLLPSVVADGPPDLPLVGPRVYARFQRGAPAMSVDSPDWFSQLNTDPIHRIAAGLGTRVVQKDQELLVQAAWAQFGEIEAARRAMVRMQFARSIAESIHSRHLARLSLGELAQCTRPVHAKLQVNGEATIAARFQGSTTPPAMLTAAFRRATRTRGPLARFRAEPLALRQLVASDKAFCDRRRVLVGLAPRAPGLGGPEGVKLFIPGLARAVAPRPLTDPDRTEVAKAIGAMLWRRKAEQPQPIAVEVDARTILASLAPAETMSALAGTRLRGGPCLRRHLPALEPILAAPRFDRPMYEALRDYDREWLVPGLGAIEGTNFVTLLATNPVFTEAFMIGLSDEMGRELLWRGFPTDQRGTYFHRFWTDDVDDFGRDIHTFTRGALGTHTGDSAGRVVLVIRGDVVRRYPDAVFLAMKAEPGSDEKNPTFAANSVSPLFHAHMSPDFLLVGFELTVDQIKNEPWYFVLAEHPTAPRFGLDVSKGPPKDRSRDNLTWSALVPTGQFLSASVSGPVIINGNTHDSWCANAALVAATLLQSPFRVVFNAKKLIKDIQEAPRDRFLDVIKWAMEAPASPVTTPMTTPPPNPVPAVSIGLRPADSRSHISLLRRPKGGR